MAKKDNKKFVDLSLEELNKELLELKRSHFKLRVQKMTHQLNDTSQLMKLRRDIARVSTRLTQLNKGTVYGS